MAQHIWTDNQAHRYWILTTARTNMCIDNKTLTMLYFNNCFCYELVIKMLYIDNKRADYLPLCSLLSLNLEDIVCEFGRLDIKRSLYLFLLSSLFSCHSLQSTLRWDYDYQEKCSREFSTHNNTFNCNIFFKDSERTVFQMKI